MWRKFYDYLGEDNQFLIDLVSPQARRYALRALAFVVANAAVLIAVPYGISLYIDGLTTGLTGAIIVGGTLFLSLGLFEALLGYWRQRVREYFFQEEFWFLPQTITERYFARPLAYLASHGSEIDGGGVESLRDKAWNVFGSYIFSIVPGWCQVTFGLAACTIAHPLAGLGAVLYTGVELALGRMNNRYVQTHMRPVIDQFKRWERRMIEWWHNVDHVKSHGVETKILRQIHDEVQEALQGDDAVWRVYFARWILIRRLLSLCFASLVYLLVGYLVLAGSVSAASGILVFFSLQRVRNVLGELSDQQREVQFNVASIAKYRRALEAPVPFSFTTGAEFRDRSIALTLERVSHSVQTEGEPKPVLRDVSLHIPAGERVGIVGPSGAGKSQLVDLLKRAIDPEAGTIWINDRPLPEIRLESLLRYYGVIMQKSEPYEDTILGNLLFGVSHFDLPRSFSDLPEGEQAWILAEAHRALAKAGLDLSSIPGDRGIFTSVGYKGTKLSGGQQQRLQIAGAHLKLALSHDRPRLILADEPTSALDSLSELTVMSHLQDALPEGTTMLMVAHRLSTVARMDRIVFVRPLTSCSSEQVQVTMHQSLRELYQSEPLFREMADAQGFVPA
jgi:ABC-type multidrug transport system fused ATPase/permease subunit